MKDTHNILSENITPEGIERLLASDFTDDIGLAYTHRSKPYRNLLHSEVSRVSSLSNFRHRLTESYT